LARVLNVKTRTPISLIAIFLISVSCAATSFASGEPPAWSVDEHSSLSTAQDRVVTLGDGSTRRLRWRISAFRGRGSSAGQPCLFEQNALFDGYSQAVECGSPAPPGDPLFTQFSASWDRGDEDVAATSFGLVFSVDVVRVTLDLVPGPSRTVRTRLLSTGQSKKSRLDQFRYLAFGVARDACLRRVIGFDGDGSEILNESPGCSGGPTTEVPAAS
jgi:hypothetical protein